MAYILIFMIDKAVCQTVDIAFNPLTFEFCRKTEAFKKMICDISVEAATKQVKDPDETISNDYKILNRMKCKGGTPAQMPVRLDKDYGDHDKAQENMQRNEDYTPKLYQEFQKQQKDHQVEQAATKAKSAVRSGGVVELARTDFETIPEKPKQVEEEEDVKKIIAPKFTITHSYGVEYADYLDDGPNKGKRKPLILVVKIQVPRVVRLVDRVMLIVIAKIVRA